MAITVKDLLEAGCHFGHQMKRWNPKMKNYVYGSKGGISIIDLTKTIRQIADSCNFLQRSVMNGGHILFVGTKRQAQQIVKETAEGLGMNYVSERWLGGTLTNNVTIRQSVARMREIDKTISAEESSGLKKKEISSLMRQSMKLHRDLDGIASMSKLPDAVFIVDVCHDEIAVKEAKKLKIPIVAIVDTNGDPEKVDYPIAANDDAVKSIKVIIDTLSEAMKDAAELYQKRVVEDKVKSDSDNVEKQKQDDKSERPSRSDRGRSDRPRSDRARGGAAGGRRPPVRKAAPKPAEKAAEATAPASADGDDKKDAKPKKKAEKPADVKKEAKPKKEAKAAEGDSKEAKTE